MIASDPSCLRRQSGIAAVELALMFPVLLTLLMLTLFLGRAMWHYSAALNAAQDAARYLSSAPSADMKDIGQVGYVVAAAQSIVAAELAELNPGPNPPTITIACDIAQCDGYSLPATVTVVVRINMVDLYFPLAPPISIPLTASVVVPYGGQ